MKWVEFVTVLLRFGASAAEVVREARRKGDTRKAGEIWAAVKSKRARMEAYERNRRRLGIEPEGEE